MRKIPNKNYFILAVLVVMTMLITLGISNIYLNTNKLTSNFYNYLNNITSDEIDTYILENPDAILYISDKYDLSNETFEKKFKNKINKLNLKDKVVYIDKGSIDEEFSKKFEKQYGVSVDFKNIPLVIVVIDSKIIKSVSIDRNIDVETFIDYGAFE